MRFVMLCIVVLTVGCNQPIYNPVTDGYPCGTRAHCCASGGFCLNDFDCGGDPGVYNCPPDYCCYAGTEPAYMGSKLSRSRLVPSDR